MASERQIAANRRNARKSKGPRSVAGKKRAGQNARRHGFSSKSWRSEIGEAVERKAREICGDLIDPDEVSLEYARTAAEAIVELDWLRAARLSLIERVIVFGTIPKPRDYKTEFAQIKWAVKIILSLERGGGQELLEPFPEEILFATMPAEKRERSFEAIRRILPALKKLERYETRAAGRRDHAIRSLLRWGAIIAPDPEGAESPLPEPLPTPNANLSSKPCRDSRLRGRSGPMVSQLRSTTSSKVLE